MKRFSGLSDSSFIMMALTRISLLFYLFLYLLVEFSWVFWSSGVSCIYFQWYSRAF